jgi:hypothetical protein
LPILSNSSLFFAVFGVQIDIVNFGVGESPMGRFRNILALSVAVAALAACQPKASPAPLPPPPVVVAPKPVGPPPRPLPPGGAAASTKVPAFGVDGVRITPNRGLSRDEQIWHFRAAINVAALNCRGPVWDQLAQNYNQFIKVHKTKLAQVNTAVDSEYRKRYPGQNALRIRDTKMTDLYNYFALPPVRQEYCDTALRKSQEVIGVPLTAFPEYAIGALGDIDGIFIRFYDAYAKYEMDIAAWNAQYAVVPFMPTTPAVPPVN